MKIKNIVISAFIAAVTSVSLAAAVPTPAKADNDCGNGEYRCGYGQTWTCCNNGDKCCSYVATDNRVWYSCVLQSQSCP